MRAIQLSFPANDLNWSVVVYTLEGYIACISGRLCDHIKIFSLPTTASSEHGVSHLNPLYISINPQENKSIKFPYTRDVR